jgi:hypothetical protein
MNHIKTSTILVLAAATLVTAACDPFPKAPGGSPAVLRAIASGGNIEQVDGPFADPTAIVVDDAPLDALFFVWFTKEMDGSTIQAFPDLDPSTGVTPLDPLLPNPAFPGPGELPFLSVENTCEVGRSPLATKVLPADASLCYASGSAQGGGIIEISSAFFWDVGAYRVGGTVRDVTGAALQFGATFNVTHKPVLLAPDGYNVDVAWANDPTATGFTIQRAEDPAGPWTNVVSGYQWREPGTPENPADPTTANNEIYRNGALVPGSTYYYRILPEGTTSPAPSNPTSVDMPGAPNLAVRANPVGPSGPRPDTVQVSLARIRGADYRVEIATVATDGTVGAYAAVATPITTVAAVPLPLANPIPAQATNPLLFNVTGLTNGTSYKLRVVPVFAGVDGTPTNASATVTVAN